MPRRHAIQPRPSNVLSIQLPQDRSCKIRLQPVDLPLPRPALHHHSDLRPPCPSQPRCSVYCNGDFYKINKASLKSPAANRCQIFSAKRAGFVSLILIRRPAHRN